MTEAVYLILFHQLLFQGLFFSKNLSLGNKLGQPVRGNNFEANAAIAFFVLFIATALYLASSEPFMARLPLPATLAKTIAVLLMLASLVVGFASLRDLGDSWRVGVIEREHTDLVENGIYGRTRNPYFVAYLLLFAAYIALLQSGTLLLLAMGGWALIHRMIRKEEQHLENIHGDSYRRYCARVPRYLL